MSRILSREFYLEVARGKISGMKEFSIPGRKDSIGTTNLEDITQTGNTALPRPGTGATLELYAANAADNITGTGVQRVNIEYLNELGEEKNITIDTNGGGVTVIPGEDICDVQWIHTVNIGSGALGVAAGNIILRGIGGGTIYEQISAGGNQSLSARYKVPINKTGYILGWQVSAVGRKIDFRLRADIERFDREINTLIFNFQDAVVIDQSPSGWIPFIVPLKCPQLSTIKISALSFTGTGDAGAQFDLLLIDNLQDIS